MAGIGRRARHTRNRAFSSTTSASSSLSQWQSQSTMPLAGATGGSYDGSTIAGGGIAGALALSGVDPMTLDPDEALTKLSVREVQAIEEKLRHAHDSLAARLRTLVAERYREMLGTANTLMDMGSSSTLLVERLDGAKDLIERAERELNQEDEEGEKRASSSPLLIAEKKPKIDNESERIEDKGDSLETRNLFTIAAGTKLVSEAPDEVWKAIDVASNMASDSLTSRSSKLANTSAATEEFKAATILRAAWIYKLAQATWIWLSSEAAASVDKLDVAEQFPFVARQWSSLAPMSDSILRAAQDGLLIWLGERSSEISGRGKKQRWEDVAVTPTSTMTSLVSLALLQDNISFSDVLKKLLDIRRRNVTHQLESLLQGLSRANVDSNTVVRRFAFLIRAVADTAVHALQLFALPMPSSDGAGRGEPCLLTLLGRLAHHDHDQKQASFPPKAMDVIQTMPSAAILAAHLPESIKTFSPDLGMTKGTLSPDEVLSRIDRWAKDVEEYEIDMEGSVTKRILGRLSSLTEISSIQIRIEDQLSLAFTKARKAWSSKDDAFQAKCLGFLTSRLHALRKTMEVAMGQRMAEICQNRASGLARAVAKGANAALIDVQPSTGLKGQARSRGSMDSFDPLSILFDSEASAASQRVLYSRQEAQTRRNGVESDHDVDDDERASCRSERVEELSSRLLLRSRKVDSLLAFTENEARVMVDELRTYETMMAAHKRGVRTKASRSLEEGQDEDEDDDLHSQEIDELYREAAKTASEEILKSLQRLMKDLTAPKPLEQADRTGGYRIGEREETEQEVREEEGDRGTQTTQLLLLSRIASGLGQSKRLSDALSPRSSEALAKTATTQNQSMLRQGLDEVRRACLAPWMKHVVKDALEAYLGSRAATNVAIDRSGADWPMKPSAELVAALTMMTQALQMAGCASQNELAGLSGQLLNLFVEGSHQQHSTGFQQLEDRFDRAILASLQKVLGGDSHSTHLNDDQDVEGWRDHLERHVSASLVPIRLLLAPFTAAPAGIRNQSPLVLWGDGRERGGQEAASRVPSISKIVDTQRAQPIPLLPIS